MTISFDVPHVIPERDDGCALNWLDCTAYRLSTTPGYFNLMPWPKYSEIKPLNYEVEPKLYNDLEPKYGPNPDPIALFPAGTPTPIPLPFGTIE